MAWRMRRPTNAYDMALVTVVASPFQSVTSAWYSDALGPSDSFGTQNWSKFDDPQVDALFIQAARSPEPGIRSGHLRPDRRPALGPDGGPAAVPRAGPGGQRGAGRKPPVQPVRGRDNVECVRCGRPSSPGHRGSGRSSTGRRAPLTARASPDDLGAVPERRPAALPCQTPPVTRSGATSSEWRNRQTR